MFYSPATIRIGINPIGWSNDAMPELGGDTPLETCLSEAAQVGYSGIEMGGKFPREAETLSQVLEGHGLQLISGWYSGNLVARSADEEWRLAGPHLQLLASQGCKVLVYAETWNESFMEICRPMSTRPLIDDTGMQAYAARLTEFADRCLAEYGIRLGIHHHIGTIIESGDDIDRLMALAGPSVGLLLDTGHCLSGGIDPIEVLRRHGARVCHVHCKDVRAPELEKARVKDLGFMEAVLEGLYTVPGDGCIDYPTLLSGLKALGYQGWLVVEAEQDPEVANPLQYARMGYDYLERTARTAGYAITR
ncbi:myo-inosose-2 dehydratase [Marinobacterium nitratireducens]|uniref:Myo-inosose-2 dehydratase n=1 Tax=Marinobacterium nitratireducens TaxID=518897 RepID=A0A917ZJH2_9GAMM|nr:myo-inosose-2 dehydratase [Marinobacterium nitratireducens]GGO84496.1 myo-inosose-2 dehydratase [Marinobacterium nitratireducens]